MYYIDFVAFMGNTDKTWNNILAKDEQSEPSLFRLGGLTFGEKEVRSLILLLLKLGFGQDYYARLSFTGQQ